MRASNALVSLVAYLGKTVWPVDLAALYPFLPVPGWKATAAGAVLALISVVVYRLAPRYPYLAMGWLWYLVTLAPVIGLVQAGGLAMADRFTYLPHIGLLVAAVWGIAEFAGRLRVSRTAVAIAAGLAIVAFTVASVRQAAYWNDSVALWERTLQVTVANYRAHNNLGVELRARGRRAEAVAHFREALNIRGDFAVGHNNLGGALAETGNLAQAVEHYRQALRLNPEYPEAHNNLGVAYANQGQLEEAIREFQHSLRIHPDQADTHANLAVMYESQGDISRAMEHFSRALRLNPQHREARRSLEGLGRRANPAAPEAGNVDLGRNPVLP
jgi:tetratricopeptide (TPR) repeat protein